MYNVQRFKGVASGKQSSAVIREEILLEANLRNISASKILRYKASYFFRKYLSLRLIQCPSLPISDLIVTSDLLNQTSDLINGILLFSKLETLNRTYDLLNLGRGAEKFLSPQLSSLNPGFKLSEKTMSQARGLPAFSLAVLTLKSK